jgi:hypothetical protein
MYMARSRLDFVCGVAAHVTSGTSKIRGLGRVVYQGVLLVWRSKIHLAETLSSSDLLLQHCSVLMPGYTKHVLYLGCYA